MKVAILSIVNYKHMTATNIYQDYFKQKDIIYDYIYLDKYNEKENVDCNKKYVYINTKKGVINKLIKALKFRRFAKKIIKQEKYDFIVVWNTQTAIIFGKFLRKHYKRKYSINIRDYFYEKRSIIRKIEKKIFKKAAYVTISSLGFKEFLPEYDYNLMHSVNFNVIKESKKTKSELVAEKPIKISFIGKVRFFAEDEKLLKEMKNDERFRMQYFGTNAKFLEKKSKENDIKNVRFVDSFPVSKTSELLDETDIINNLYGFNDPFLDYAVSIRTYYSAFLYKPILVYEGTYMEKMLSTYNISIVISHNLVGLGDYIYNAYIEKIGSKDFYDGCDRFQKDILLEQEKLIKKFDTTFKKEKQC